jgi:RNA polymerase sigma-70 factor (ECF subfamily)
LLVRDENDANDIVQEAFLRVFRKIEDYAGDASFYTWLYRIVYNLSVDFLRRPYRRRVGLEQLESLLGPFTAQAFPRVNSQRPDDAVHGLELFESITNALAQLSVHHREVIILREVWGMSYGEMAQYLGCARGTVMSRLFHARQRLQILLHDVYAVEFAEEGVRTGNQRLNDVPTFGSLST